MTGWLCHPQFLVSLPRSKAAAPVFVFFLVGKGKGAGEHLKMFQFSSVAQLCLIFCDPMDCSMPGSPVLHYLLSLLKLMSIESVMPSSHLILYYPLLLLSSIYTQYN